LDDFVDGRNAIVAAARELGAADSEIQAIEDDFDGHGITEGWDVAASNDATILMQDVAPITDIGFSEPQLSGTRFAIGDYADKTQICCAGIQIFAGRTDGSEPVSQISEGAGSSVLSDESPDVSGDRIIWSRIHLQNARPVSADIVGRTGTGAQKRIASTGAMLMNPAIDGRLVAWERIGRNTDIQARYLGRPIATVRDGRGNQLMPQVAGDWIAWWNTNGQPRIEALNARTGAQRVVKAADRFTFVGPPSLQGRYLLWYQDNDFDAVGSIRRLDLVTGAKKVLVPESSGAAPIWALSVTSPPLPSANSSSVVYSSELAYALEFGGHPELVENDEVGRDIFIVPLNGGQAESVTSNRADQAFPLMGALRRVIWLDSSEGRTDLVTREVP
jgi:bacillolysin